MNGQEDVSNLALALETVSSSGSVTRGAQYALSELGRDPKKYELSHWEISEALGHKCSAWSAAGAYYRMQGMLLRFLTPGGALIVSTFGLYFVAMKIRDVASNVWPLIRKMMTFAGWLMNQAQKVLGWDEEGTLIYDEDIAPEMIATTMEAAASAMLTGPLVVIVNGVKSVIGQSATSTSVSARPVSAESQMSGTPPISQTAQTGIAGWLPYAQVGVDLTGRLLRTAIMVDDEGKTETYVLVDEEGEPVAYDS